MSISVHKENGDMLEVTLATLFGMLADERSYQTVLGRLLHGAEFEVELLDGLALIQRMDCRQPALPLIGYTADARLTFEVPARIHCQACSSTEARNLVADVIHGSRSMPPGFTVEVDGDEVDNLFANLHIGNTIPVQDITITGITPRLLLAGGTRT